MEVFRTTGVPSKSRAAYWSHGYTSRFSSIAAKPVDPDTFHAELRIETIGPATFACVRSKPTTVERTVEQAKRECERMFAFMMLVRGSGAVRIRGRETSIEAGDVMLTDTTEPIVCSYTEPVIGISARVSETALRSRLPAADDLWGQKLAGGSPLTNTAISMARCLTKDMTELPPAQYSGAVAGYLLDVLAMSYSLASDRDAEDVTQVGVRLSCIRSFVENNLENPDLSPFMVAEAIEISPRYVRKLMERHGETLSGLILRRRLEESAKRLSSPVHRRRTVTDIAFSLGFNSTAHFARVFKTKYGVTPSEYRASQGRPTGVVDGLLNVH